MTGSFGWQSFVLEPSVRVYALWEREDSYVDSLGALQSEHSFFHRPDKRRRQGELSLRVVEHPPSHAIRGFYGDYYFSRDDAIDPNFTTVPLLIGE